MIFVLQTAVGIIRGEKAPPPIDWRSSSAGRMRKFSVIGLKVPNCGSVTFILKVSDTARWSTVSMYPLTWPEGGLSQLGGLNEMDSIQDEAIGDEFCQSGGGAPRHTFGPRMKHKIGKLLEEVSFDGVPSGLFQNALRVLLVYLWSWKLVPCCWHSYCPCFWLVTSHICMLLPKTNQAF